MPKAKEDKSQYVVVSPVTPKGKWQIAARRLGSEDKYAIIGETRSEGFAANIVQGLHLLQGEVAKLTVPAEQQMEGLRAQLETERTNSRRYEREASERYNKIRELQSQLDRVTNERNTAQKKLYEIELKEPS